MVLQWLAQWCSMAIVKCSNVGNHWEALSTSCSKRCGWWMLMATQGTDGTRDATLLSHHPVGASDDPCWCLMGAMLSHLRIPFQSEKRQDEEEISTFQLVHYGPLWFTMVHYGSLWSTTCCSSTFRPPRFFVTLSFPRCCRTTSSSGRIGAAMLGHHKARRWRRWCNTRSSLGTIAAGLDDFAWFCHQKPPLRVTKLLCHQKPPLRILRITI